MGKIDKIKESLNTLRVVLSILFGLEALIVGGLIARFDNDKIDEIFLYGAILFFIILIVLFIVFVKISKKTNEIEEL